MQTVIKKKYFYVVMYFYSLEPDYQKILLYSNALALPLKAVTLCFISLSPECSI